MTIEELADYAKDFFEQKRRDDGSSYWKLKDDYPTWVREMLFRIHDKGHWLPDDYKYEFAVDALYALAEGQDPEEGAYEIEPDVYTNALHKWLTSHPYRSTYVDEAVREFGWPKEGGLDQALMGGQVLEKQEVWRLVLDALNERLEEIELEEPEVMRSEEERRRRKPGQRRQDWSPR